MKKYMDDGSIAIDKILEDCQSALKVKSQKNLSLLKICFRSILACQGSSST